MHTTLKHTFVVYHVCVHMHVYLCTSICVHMPGICVHVQCVYVWKRKYWLSHTETALHQETIISSNQPFSFYIQLINSYWLDHKFLSFSFPGTSFLSWGWGWRDNQIPTVRGDLLIVQEDLLIVQGDLVIVQGDLLSFLLTLLYEALRDIIARVDWGGHE